MDRVDTIRDDLDEKCPDLTDQQRSAVDMRLVKATEGLSVVSSWESALEIGGSLNVGTMRTDFSDCRWSAVDPKSFSDDDLILLEQILDPAEIGQ